MGLMNTQDLVIKLKELKPLILARYKAREIALFGSFVRGEQGASSDIDVLVEFEEEADLFDLIGLSPRLEEEFHRKVDVILKRALREELRESVLQQLVAL
jgi:predicted nucleotidyltransferase